MTMAPFAPNDSYESEKSDWWVSEDDDSLPSLVSRDSGWGRPRGGNRVNIFTDRYVDDTMVSVGAGMPPSIFLGMGNVHFGPFWMSNYSSSDEESLNETDVDFIEPIRAFVDEGNNDLDVVLENIRASLFSREVQLSYPTHDMRMLRSDRADRRVWDAAHFGEIGYAVNNQHPLSHILSSGFLDGIRGIALANGSIGVRTAREVMTPLNVAFDSNAIADRLSRVARIEPSNAASFEDGVLVRQTWRASCLNCYMT